MKVVCLTLKVLSVVNLLLFLSYMLYASKVNPVGASIGGVYIFICP